MTIGVSASRAERPLRALVKAVPDFVASGAACLSARGFDATAPPLPLGSSATRDVVADLAPDTLGAETPYAFCVVCFNLHDRDLSVYTLVRRYIKTAIGFLIVGLLIGSWMLLQREFGPRIVTPYQTSAHTHAIFVGFVMMMICGVSLWLFPRPDKSDRQYRPGFVQAAYWMLTVGTAVRIAGELLRPSLSAPLWLRVGIVNGGLLQVVGLTLFFYTMWSRIRAVGSQTREAKGERF